MIATQIYYDFTREMERLKANLNNTNTTFNRDMLILTKQLTQVKTGMEVRNREMEKHLSELKRMMFTLYGNP